MEFGRKPEGEVVGWFGARTIKTSVGVDFLYDRRSFSGELSDEFKRWLDKEAVPALNKAIKHDREGLFAGSSRHVWKLDKGKFHIEASCQSSYGYVYVGAWISE